MNSNWLSLR